MGQSTKKYLKWLSEKPCMFCGQPATEPHHIRSLMIGCGIGLKAPDKYAIPTCADCHRNIHRGQKTFFEKFGKTVDDMIEYAEKSYENFEHS